MHNLGFCPLFHPPNVQLDAGFDYAVTRWQDPCAGGLAGHLDGKNISGYSSENKVP